VGTEAKIGWRALFALAFSGVLAGFTVPAIATSLVQQEKQQPKVRLLRAPRLPSSETQLPSPESRTSAIQQTAPIRTPQPLTLSQLEKKARRLPSPRITFRPNGRQTTSAVPPSSATAPSPAHSKPTPEPKAKIEPVPNPSSKAPAPAKTAPTTPPAAPSGGNANRLGGTSAGG
jgi:hypothetical protein